MKIPQIPCIQAVMIFRALLLPFLLIPLGGAGAEASQIRLASPAASVAFRAYGMGLLPLDGNFTRFEGVLTYDEPTRGDCQVVLRVDVASLTMGDTSIRDDIVGPDFMNAESYPTLRFEGACRGPEVAGELLMHGVTHPFTLDLERNRSSLVAQGRLRRAEWGVTGRPFLGGSTVRITVQVTLPPEQEQR